MKKKYDHKGAIPNTFLGDSAISLHEVPGVPSDKKNLLAMRQTQERWVQSLGQEDSLKEGMETHSSILPWRISWTEESGDSV